MYVSVYTIASACSVGPTFPTQQNPLFPFPHSSHSPHEPVITSLFCIPCERRDFVRLRIQSFQLSTSLSVGSSCSCYGPKHSSWSCPLSAHSNQNQVLWFTVHKHVKIVAPNSFNFAYFLFCMLKVWPCCCWWRCDWKTGFWAVRTFSFSPEECQGSDFQRWLFHHSASTWWICSLVHQSHPPKVLQSLTSVLHFYSSFWFATIWEFNKLV